MDAVGLGSQSRFIVVEDRSVRYIDAISGLDFPSNRCLDVKRDSSV